MASKGTIGGKIVLEGEQAYRQALKNIKTAQAELRSEMKLAQSQFKDSANSLTALTAKQEILTKQVDTSQKKVDLYSKAVADSARKQEEAKKALDELKNSQTATDAEIEKAQKDYDNATNQLSKYQTNLNYAEAELNDMKEQLAKTGKQVEEASNSMDGCAHSIDEFGNEVKDTKDEVSVFGDVLKANLTSEAIISSVKAIANGIKTIATAAIETGMEFEASMDKVAALSGATGDDLQKLTDLAKEMGATTMYSASEAADALSYMALAGWDTNSMLKGLNPVLNLAAASGMDLATTSDIVTDYLTAFGLKAEDAGRFTDQLAYAMANSNTNVSQLGEAFKNSASTAASLGYSVEDVTAVLMTMANAGVKGGEAGTGLATIMTRLATNTKGCADELAKYGIEVYDAQGNMNSLSNILGGLGNVWSTLSQQEQAALAKSIAGTAQYSRLQTIMNGVSESAQEGGQSFYDYAEALQDCEGAASDMAFVMNDNLKGKITILESALDALKVSTYEVFDDVLKNSVDGATDAITRLNASVSSGKMNVSLNKMADALGNFLSGAIDLGESVLPVVIDGFTWLLDNADYIAVGIGGIVAAQAAMGVASGIQTAISAWNAYKTANEGATVAQWLLNAAMDANPVGAMVVAIEAAVAALAVFAYWMYESSNSASEAVIEARDLTEEQQKNTEALKGSIEARKDATRELEASGTATNNLIDRLEELTNKTNLTAAEQAELQSIITQLNQQYPSLNVNVDENGKLIGKTTAEIRKQADTYLQLYKVQAAQQDLIDISNDLYQAEKQRAELETARLPLEEQLRKEAEAQGIAFEGYIQTLEARALMQGSSLESLNAEAAAYRDITEQITDLDGTIVELNEEYATASDYVANNSDVLNDNSENVEDNAEAYARLQETLGDTADAFSDLSADAMNDISDLADAVESSVESSMNAFEAFNEQTAISKEELIKNLDSQIAGITNWSNNLQALARRGVSQGLLQELAKLGPEGYRYVEAFLSMTDSELSDYDQKFADYVRLPESTKSNIVAQYRSMGEDVVRGFNTGVGNLASEAQKKVSQTFYQTAMAAKGILKIKSPSRVFKEIGEYTGEGFIWGFEDSMKDVNSVVANALPDASTVQASIDTNVSLNNSSSSNAVLSLLSEYLPALANMQIVMDTGQTVGALAQPMDSALGQLAMQTRRGV